MEFWGVEVKAGQPLKVKPTFDNIIHLSQASLGETKKEKGHDSVPLFVKFGDQKLVLGTLITETIPQLSFDLVFEKEFELSHNWKNGSVYFCGYQTPLPADDSEEFDMEDSDEEEEDELPTIPAANGKAGPKVENVKPVAKALAAKALAAKPDASAKPNKDVKPKEDEDDDSDDDSDDSMEDGFEDADSDEMSDEEGGSEDDSDEEDESDEEETPKKVEVGKKRPGGSATKTPVSVKKAKAGTPQTDGKKGGHVATPHPSKQGGKTPANGDKTPKSGGQHSCKPCSKTFGSDVALQSHNKAKHSGGK